MEDTDIEALNPNLAFWALCSAHQSVLLYAVRCGVSASALKNSFSHTLHKLQEEHCPHDIRLLRLYLRGLKQFQQRWKLT